MSRAHCAPLAVLFICSRNQWRSPTAERIFRKHPGLAVRSAGTSRSAKRTVTEADLAWADVVLVMEDKHRSRLRGTFGPVLQHKPVRVLHIPDEYGFMDPALVESLGAAVSAALPELDG